MHLPPLQSPSMTHYCTSGDVSIAPDAAIAAGSVLKADSDCAIVIGAGVCLGLGSVLHANGGTITVEAGASLGAGTVIVGHCRIGAQACIGTSTTIYNVSVAPGQLVPPASLLGNMGRPVEATTSTPDFPSEQPRASTAGKQVGTATDKRNSGEASPPKAAKMEQEPSPWDEVDTEIPAASSSSSSTSTAKPARPSVVYGKAQFEQIRGAMFSRREDI